MRWDPAKNEKLKRERGVTFEEVVYHIEQGDVIHRLPSLAVAGLRAAPP